MLFYYIATIFMVKGKETEQLVLSLLFKRVYYILEAFKLEGIFSTNDEASALGRIFIAAIRNTSDISISLIKEVIGLRVEG